MLLMLLLVMINLISLDVARTDVTIHSFRRINVTLLQHGNVGVNAGAPLGAGQVWP